MNTARADVSAAYLTRQCDDAVRACYADGLPARRVRKHERIVYMAEYERRVKLLARNTASMANQVALHKEAKASFAAWPASYHAADIDRFMDFYGVVQQDRASGEAHASCAACRDPFPLAQPGVPCVSAEAFFHTYCTYKPPEPFDAEDAAIEYVLHQTRRKLCDAQRPAVLAQGSHDLPLATAASFRFSDPALLDKQTTDTMLQIGAALQHTPASGFVGAWDEQQQQQWRAGRLASLYYVYVCMPRVWQQAMLRNTTDVSTFLDGRGQNEPLRSMLAQVTPLVDLDSIQVRDRIVAMCLAPAAPAAAAAVL